MYLPNLRCLPFVLASTLFACTTGSSEQAESDLARQRQTTQNSPAQAASAGDDGCPQEQEPTQPAPDAGADHCSGIAEAQCVTMNSCRAGYAGFCDCTCGTFTSGGKVYEVGGCESCPASCFSFAGCVTP